MRAAKVSVCSFIAKATNLSGFEKREILEQYGLLRRAQFMRTDFIKNDDTPASSGFQLKKSADGTIEDGLSADLERLTTLDMLLKMLQDSNYMHS